LGAVHGATAQWPSGFAGGGDGGDGRDGGDGVNEAITATWLRLAKREREKAEARGARTTGGRETDRRRSGLPSEAQHGCGVTKSTWDEDQAVGADDNDAKMQRCKDAKMQRCKGARMQGCKDAKMQCRMMREAMRR
jgi:hypothetical protein